MTDFAKNMPQDIHYPVFRPALAAAAGAGMCEVSVRVPTARWGITGGCLTQNPGEMSLF